MRPVSLDRFAVADPGEGGWGGGGLNASLRGFFCLSVGLYENSC